MLRFNSAGHRSRGFSLLEVMIAVVILATGLLALAALQGSLTRSSAEAKVRGRVVAMLSARLDALRSAGYGTLANGTTTTTSTTDPCDGDATDWIDCTRVQAGLGSLSSTQTVSTWSGTATFISPTTPGPKVAQFKRVNLSATWSDASGASHLLAMASDISPLGLTNSLVPPPDDQTSGGAGPVVRTTSPATAGVIPIALGNGNSSAASNPTPELVGQQSNQHITGTKFNVLTYSPPVGSAVVIKKRFENEIIKCSCRYGAGGTNLPAIYQTAQWPAIWTGDRYDLYKPSPVSDAPGQALSSGPKSGVEQSPLCQECCRDHHDTSTTGIAKFDPERSDGITTKYYLNNANVLTAVNNTNSGTDYVNACRAIRVDGFWRTASDMYSRQFGLLETETVSGAKAKTGLPTTSATTAYTTFVKNYLKQYGVNPPYDGTVGTAPTGAQDLFEGTANINDPLLPGVIISTPSNTDYRYLHGRGLYVDYLEEKARTKLADVLADNGPQGRCPTAVKTSNLENCVLPYLPFTSANLTEIATWLASKTSVLGVNSGNLLATNPTQPSGSRSIGKTVGTSDNTATARKSNSGVAINTETSFANLNGVDPTDNSAVGTDVQPFQVGGTAPIGDEFHVKYAGLSGRVPHVFYTIGSDGPTECLSPDAGITHICDTNTAPLTVGSILLQKYSKLNPSYSQVVTCSDGPHTVPGPALENWSVSNVQVCATNGTGACGPSVGSIGSPQPNDSGLTLETTTVSGLTLPTWTSASSSVIKVTFVLPTGSQYVRHDATYTCNFAGPNFKGVTFQSAPYPWD